MVAETLQPPATDEGFDGLFVDGIVHAFQKVGKSLIGPIFAALRNNCLSRSKADAFDTSETIA